jgi:hypothetical protein
LALPDRLDETSFAYLDITSQDAWKGTWTVIFGSLTVVGATNYVGRYHVEGKVIRFQVRFSAATSIASSAGTDYLNLPIASKGLGGMATMTNASTNVAVGVGHIDATNARCYLPSQAVSGDTFILAGWYEIG